MQEDENPQEETVRKRKASSETDADERRAKLKVDAPLPADQPQADTSLHAPITRRPAISTLPQLAVEEGFDISLFEDRVWDILSTAVEYKVRTLAEEAIRVARRSLKYAPQVIVDLNCVLTAAKLGHWSSVSLHTLKHTLTMSGPCLCFGNLFARSNKRRSNQSRRYHIWRT